MFDIPGFNAAATDQPRDVQEPDSAPRSYLHFDPVSLTTHRMWRTGDVPAAPPPMAMGNSPSAKTVGAMAAEAGKSVRDPLVVADEHVQKYSNPTPYRDAQGKTLPQYRMGIGHRILGTLANFASGFAGRNAEPIYVGPGALNNRYYQDEQERQQNLEGAQRRRGLLQGNKYRNEVNWRTIGRDSKTGKWFGVTYGGERREIGTPQWEMPETPEQNAPQKNDGGDDGQSSGAGSLNRNAIHEPGHLQPVGNTVPPPAPTQVASLGRADAERYLSLARGNKHLARRLARLDGHVV